MSEALPQSQLNQILIPWIGGRPTVERSWLKNQLLANPQRADAFGITSTNVDDTLDQRLHWLQAVYPSLDRFCRTSLGWTNCPLALLWDLWLPIAIQLAQEQQSLGRCLIQGILGGQGTGKTTLSRILANILTQMQWRVCTLSLDDLYKTYADRQQLQHQDPRFRWRGPPGTHDVELGISVLQQFRSASQQPVVVPRFDKSLWQGAGDRTQPEIIAGADIVLFEGWFVGVRPIDPATFATAPAPITTDADRAFARDINDRLYAYLPLWQLLDRLMVLYPRDYRFSQQWRQQAEQQMIAAGRSGMTQTEIHEFVEYFWRSLHPELFILPLSQNCHTDLVVEIDAAHNPMQIYRPQPK
jgi:D-glycerate 3-kinase